MIHELVALLPRCYLDFTQSTEVMVFRHISSKDVDSVIGYGNTINAGYTLQNPELNKYKSIETLGNCLIERIIISKEPIDLDKKWWNSKQSITVLQTKVYVQDTAYILRNMVGVTDLSYKLRVGNTPAQIAEIYTFNNLYNNFLAPALEMYNFNAGIVSLLGDIIPDTDIAVLETASDCDFKYSKFEGDIKHLINLIGGLHNVPLRWVDNLAYDTIPLCKLENNIDKRINMHIYQELMDNIEVPFGPNEVDFISSVEYSWELLEILYILNRSPYTDIKIEYDVRKDVAPVITAMSRYTGKQQQRISSLHTCLGNGLRT